MEIVIQLNKYIYFLKDDYSQFHIRLLGDLNYNNENKIKVILENKESITFSNLSELETFSKEIRGKNKDGFLYSLYKNDINKSPNFENYLDKQNENIFNGLKSIFLLFNWLEIPLMNQEYEELSIDNNLYDEFVIDLTSKPESQKDIYLIKKEHIKPENAEILEHLEKINLLCKISINPYRNKKLTSYFIPLNQFGIQKHLFEFIDNTRQKRTAYPFWKKIIEERNIRISNWINNRY